MVNSVEDFEDYIETTRFNFAATKCLTLQFSAGRLGYTDVFRHVSQSIIDTDHYTAFALRVGIC